MDQTEHLFAGHGRFFFEETALSRPPLCPEIQLRLITPDCRLFRATGWDADAMRMGEPYWAFAWAGGQALARYLLDHPGEVAGKRVLDFGSGSGIVAIAASMAGAVSVLASDIDPVACEAIRINAALNDVTVATTIRDLVGEPIEADLVTAGDMTYEPELAARVIGWFHDLVGAGRRVFFGDPGRGFVVDDGLTRLAEYMAPTDNDWNGRLVRAAMICEVEGVVSNRSPAARRPRRLPWTP